MSGSTAWFISPLDPLPILTHPERRALSVMNARFTLAEATDYQLDASVRLHGAYWGGAARAARVVLTGPSGSVADVAHHDPGPCDPPCDPSLGETLARSGILEAGTYTLTAEMEATASGHAACIGEFGDAFEGRIDHDLRLGMPVPSISPGGIAGLVASCAGTGIASARRRAQAGRSRPSSQ